MQDETPLPHQIDFLSSDPHPGARSSDRYGPDGKVSGGISRGGCCQDSGTRKASDWQFLADQFKDAASVLLLYRFLHLKNAHRLNPPYVFLLFANNTHLLVDIEENIFCIFDFLNLVFE